MLIPTCLVQLPGGRFAIRPSSQSVAARAITLSKGMAAAGREVTEAELEAQLSTKAKSGFKGVTFTTSRKFQARIFVKTGLPQLDLGTFNTAEDAARAVAAAKAKRKRGEEVRHEPVRDRAARGTVSIVPSVLLAPSHTDAR